MEEALIQMYRSGVSVRGGEDITQAPWGLASIGFDNQRFEPEDLLQDRCWRQWPLVGDFPYVFLDGAWLKLSWGGEVKNISVLVAIGVGQSGYREILGVSEGAKDTARVGRRFCAN